MTIPDPPVRDLDWKAFLEFSLLIGCPVYRGINNQAVLQRITSLSDLDGLSAPQANVVRERIVFDPEQQWVEERRRMPVAPTRTPTRCPTRYPPRYPPVTRIRR